MFRTRKLLRFNHNMRNWLLLLSFLCFWLLHATALLSGEQRSIDKCLQSFGGLNSDNAARLERYKEWSDNYEEVPCFTRCYLAEMFDFYHKSAGFDERKIAARFGQAIYTACSDRLKLPEGQQSSCQHAYSAFHCIVSLEDDPFILIENMPNITRNAKSAMKECLQQVDQEEWDQMSAYGRFPVQEPIPCFTRCFIRMLQLFNDRTHRWRLDAMRQALGVPLAGADITACGNLRGRNPCIAMYKQFTCYVKAK